MSFDPDQPYRLSEQVAVRPEPVGALLYHFGTRKLSFLKDKTLLRIVESLGSQPSAWVAVLAAGVEEDSVEQYLTAIRVLCDSKMVSPADEVMAQT